MTLSATSSERAGRPATLALPGGIWAAVLLVFPLALLMSWPKIGTVWQTGAFFDSDDAMRAVQVRDWMAGQGWFDLTAHRLDPPLGIFMHWSRVVDVPIAALIRLFSLFTDSIASERLARIAFPLALQAGMIAATAWVARILAGPRAGLPAAVLLVLGGMTYGQFQPGRIDHHAPQILLLMGMTGTALLSLDPRRPRMAAWSGLLMALSLAISLENMPFIAVLALAPPIAWALNPQAYRAVLVWQAIGLGIAAPLLFLATVGPAHYGIAVPDAFSIAHLTAVLMGAAGTLALALLTTRLGRPWFRWAALSGLGLAVAVTVRMGFPDALHDPYFYMDALVRDVLVANITEAQSVFVAVARRPETFPIMICPLIAGTLAALVAISRETGLARWRWLLLVGLLCSGGAGMIWGIRVATSVQPLAMLGGAWAVARGLDLYMRRRGTAWILLPLALFVPFSAFAWAALPSPAPSSDSDLAMGGAAPCRAPSAFAPLAGLQAGLSFASIDAGSHILAFTDLSVIGAPYRSRAGNRVVIQGFMAEPEAAKGIVEGSGARYLMFCAKDPLLKLLTRLSPDGLAGRMTAGQIPSWLRPIRLQGTPYEVYAVE